MRKIINKLRYIFIFPIKQFFFKLRMPYHLKLQEIPLYQIYVNQKFDLSDPTYDFGKLYNSLLKDGLNTNNHSPILVTSLIWTGDNGDWCRDALQQGFRYTAIDGNHRIATLQFINLSKKLKILGPEIRVKVAIITSSYYNKLDKYELLGDWQGEWKFKI